MAIAITVNAQPLSTIKVFAAIEEARVELAARTHVLARDLMEADVDVRRVELTHQGELKVDYKHTLMLPTTIQHLEALAVALEDILPRMATHGLHVAVQRAPAGDYQGCAFLESERS